MTYELLGGGVFRETCAPVFGKQDLGLSPRGPLDRFSYETGNILLENPGEAPALEIIFPPRIRFIREALFVVTGGSYTSMRLIGDTVRPVPHAEVCRAYPLDILEFGEKAYGFRTYFCYKPVDAGEGTHILGRTRGDFSKIAQWPDPSGRIRVVDGPEKSILKKPDDFFHQHFLIHPDSNAMGLRLKEKDGILEVFSRSNMISGPVADGTVQLTPKGPVILLRHRQTIGGYPRIFNVITPDLDLLAQYAPGQHIRFKRVSLNQALACLKQWHEDLENIKHHDSEV